MVRPETPAITPDKLSELSIDAPIGWKSLTMKNYEFSIIASGLDPEAADFELRFYEAGCDDATISFQKGHIILDFARDSETMEIAISSAVDAVIAVGAKVDRVEPDPLVSLSEIASRTGMSRAAMTQYSKGQRSKNFPAPVVKVTSDSPLWDWATVALWLFRNNKLTRDAVIEAQTVKVANRAIESGERHIHARVKQCVDSYAATI